MIAWLRSVMAAIGAAFLTKEGLSIVAMVASIAGGAVLTGLLWRSMESLIRAGQWDAVANLAYGLLATVALVLLSLGFVISRRSFEAEFWKVKFKAATQSDGGEA